MNSINAMSSANAMSKRNIILTAGAIILMLAGIAGIKNFLFRTKIRPNQPPTTSGPVTNAPATPSQSLRNTNTSSTVASNNLIINTQKTYQKMLGFGSFISRFDEPHMLYSAERGDPKDTIPQLEKEKILADAYTNLFLDSITLGIGPRTSPSYDWPSSWEVKNDDSDPNNINWSGFRFSNSYWDPIFKNIQAIQKRIEARGGKLTLILKHSWGLESWLAELGGHQAQSSFAAEYAENLTAFILWAKNTYKIEATYVVPMNEPDGAGGLTPEKLVKVIDALGPMLAKNNLKTKIAAPEAFTALGALPYLAAIAADSQASKYVKLLGYHSYDRDLSIMATGDAVSRVSIANYAKQLGADVIQGEYSACCKQNEKTFWNNSFAQGLAWAQDFYFDLTTANAGGVDMQLSYWQINDPSAYVLIKFDQNKNYVGYEKSKFYYPLAQYINYVRPGMVRVDTQSGDKNILATSFVDPATKKYVLVLVNTADTTTALSLSFVAKPPLTLTRTRSSANEQMVNLGSLRLKTGSSIYQDAVAPRSVTTYFGNLP